MTLEVAGRAPEGANGYGSRPHCTSAGIGSDTDPELLVADSDRDDESAPLLYGA